MEKQRIKISDLVIGQPLLWNIYDADNHLLLGKGQIIEREQQVEMLIQRGLFVDAASLDKKEEVIPAQKERPSVLHLICLANKRLESLLLNLNTEVNAAAKLLEIAQVITFAADLNTDIALASILLNQHAGNYPVRHCIDTALVSLLITRAMKKSQDEVQAVTAAALTMNIGMMAHQKRLQEVKGPLSEEDALIVRSHPQQSVAVLRQVGVTNEDWLSFVMLHHENEDGSGYPLGKHGCEIPLGAKIISITDRYCARVSARNYRKSLLPNAALRDILVEERNKVDPVLATAFIRELGTYPMGSFVKLENGEVAVVSGKGSTTTAPIVHALVGPRGAPLPFPIRRNTSLSLYSIREVLREEEANIRFSMQQVWGGEARM